MTKDEVRALLEYASVMDARPVTDQAVDVWFDIVEPVDYALAIAIAREHFATTAARLMPAHIMGRARALRGNFYDRMPPSRREDTPDDPARLADYRRRRGEMITSGLRMVHPKMIED